MGISTRHTPQGGADAVSMKVSFFFFFFFFFFSGRASRRRSLAAAVFLPS